MHMLSCCEVHMQSFAIMRQFRISYSAYVMVTLCVYHKKKNSLPQKNLSCASILLKSGPLLLVQKCLERTWWSDMHLKINLKIFIDWSNHKILCCGVNWILWVNDDTHELFHRRFCTWYIYADKTFQSWLISQIFFFFLIIDHSHHRIWLTSTSPLSQSSY